MYNERRLAIYLVLALAGVFTSLPAADACHRQRHQQVCFIEEESAVKEKTLAVTSVPIKGVIFDATGKLRTSASVFITVMTAEAGPVLIGGSSTSPITTGSTFGN